MPKVIFIQPDESRQEVDVPDGWSVMEGARRDDVPGILAECGGGALCATCHVHVDPAWQAVTGAASEMETMLLELAPGRDDSSRLSCQILVTDEMDGLVVRVPGDQASMG